MCGIAALFAYGPSAPLVAADELAKINQAMIRRGPDGGGSWISGDRRVGLAHRRLAIIDPNIRANQPMVINERYWITFNGEIYNFRVLRTELQSEGVDFTTESDTEVLLRLYERDGAEMISKLRGMFAFIIWDEAERRLFMARDAFGIKPLYIADNGSTIRIASSVKALRAGGHAGNIGPDPAGHVGFFLFGSVPEPHTLYADIGALEAGHTLSIESDGTRRHECYFDTRKCLLNSRPDGKSADLRGLLVDSIENHFVADVPVGVFLSAGLDSASITGLASEGKQGDLRTFTLGFQEFSGTPNDEVPLAEMIAERYGTKHLTERVDRSTFDSVLPNLMSSMDQPSIDGLNTFLVSQSAAKQGLKVALSGIGGDELFAGYDSFRQVPSLAKLLGWIPGLPEFGRVFRAISAPLVGTMFSPKYASLFEYGGTIAGSYLLRRGLFMPWEIPNIIDPDLAAAGWKLLQPIVRLETEISDLEEVENRIRVLETCFYLRNQLLRDADWAGMAHSLEIRVPFVDVELFKALAPRLGTASSPKKGDMAKTVRYPLPSNVLNKSKSGFSIPTGRWLDEIEGGTNYSREPGLRSWAQYVYKAQTAV